MSDEFSSRSYYVNRAITRKIMREGTGLDVSRCTDTQLWDRLSDHAAYMSGYMLESNIMSPRAARAAWEIPAIVLELRMRGVQLTMPWGDDQGCRR